MINNKVTLTQFKREPKLHTMTYHYHRRKVV